jgi:endo-1,4-beta-xylanase
VCAGNKLLRPSPDSFDFTAADQMAKFAQAHGLLLRGHTLVWHESLPSWFENTVNRQNAEQILVKHIKTVVGRYTGKMHSWDVVNEAISHDPTKEDGLTVCDKRHGWSC